MIIAPYLIREIKREQHYLSTTLNVPDPTDRHSIFPIPCESITSKAMLPCV